MNGSERYHPNSPEEKHSESRREKLFVQLDKRVGQALEVQSIVDQEMLAPKSDEARRKLKDFRSHLWADASDSEIQRRDEWSRLAVRHEELTKGGSDQEIEDMTEEQLAQVERDDEELRAVSKRMDDIEHDDDFLFRLDLDRLTARLAEKAERVARYRHDRAGLLRDATEAQGAPVDRSSIQRIVFDTFGVTFVMVPEYIDAQYPGATGYHSHDSPFSYATDRGIATKATIEHERLHNIVDAAPIWHGEPARLIKSRYERLRKLEEIHAPEVILNSERQSLKELLERPAEKLVDLLHDELLAGYDGLRAEMSKHPEVFLNEKPMTLPLKTNPSFSLMAKYGSTAGKEAWECAGALEAIARENPDSELAFLAMK
ncbi:MAG: hypothetical protein AAB619_03190, partial [Patescibacteria group bacterium]